LSNSHEKIHALIKTAISDNGFIAIMGEKMPSIRQDIPAAFEAYSLLSFFLDKLPMRSCVFEASHPVDLAPAILHDATAGLLVALLPVGAGGLTFFAHWITDNLRSDQVKRMPGVLALPFSIERHDELEHLLPEWFAAFYVHGDPGHCIPILTLRSVLTDERFGGDWVDTALARMASFALPKEQAVNAAIVPQ